MLAGSESDLQGMMDRLNMVSVNYNMKINAKKTKVLRVAKDQNQIMKIVVAGEIVEQVKEFCYLGSMISDDATEKSREATAASIWFEIWGVVDPGQKNFDFYRQIFEKFQFLQAILQKNIEFCRQISENFDFFRQLKKSIFQAKIFHLQLPLVKLFYFSSKVTTFEHTSCT